jgi:hypothetical protein
MFQRSIQMDQEQSRLNEVIQICIEYCQMANDPAEQVEAFAAGLKAAGWTEPDANSVAKAAVAAILTTEGEL